ncbi:MAG: hypothetical protein CMG75_05910 [Candidatus Marinimicrobia bacterium]|nr:hypothetical protein [Candidatus Neomarinimicrobiota bacterium]|tara:strand:- start:2606 stop:3778 length:1173 start_codon:yes stop_codon:yes gene_type:complete
MRVTSTQYLTLERARDLLEKLVSFNTINPMGKTFNGPMSVETDANNFVSNRFSGLEQDRISSGPCHESLLIKLPGEDMKLSPILFESHMDTVPADDWMETALSPRVENNVLYARGACDDKGSLTAMLLALEDIWHGDKLPPHPIWMLVAGDEEYAQTGIKEFRERGDTLALGIFGEPTRLQPVVQHKGTVRWDIEVHGRSAHTSRPELGVNAIYFAMSAIAELELLQNELQLKHKNALMTGPMLTVTMIKGGRTRNAVPDLCTLSIDHRVVPGMDPMMARKTVINRLEKIENASFTHKTPQLITPPLATNPENSACQTILKICRKHQNNIELRGEPYGTDAAWIADKAPALVLGPGDITYAHAIDERIALDDVVTGAKIYRDIMLTRFTN